MRIINVAYKTVMQHLDSGYVRPSAPSRSAQPPRDPRPAATSDRRLSREEIDAMVNAIGTEGPLDTLFGELGWVGSSLEGCFTVLLIVLFFLRVAFLVVKGNWAQFLQEPEILVLLGIIGFLGVREFFKRRKLESR